MDPNDLHAALSDLAGTAGDDPGLLASVHHRARRNRRRRVVLTSGSALAVLGVALAAGEGGFSSGPPPPPFASSPPTSTTTTTSAQAAATPGPACRMQVAVGGGVRPGGVMGIQSWTGSPPAVGQAFDVTGTVTAVASDTLTIMLNTVGGVGGTLTVGAAHEPPLAQTGASAAFRGTRTGPTTYQLTSGTISLRSGAVTGQSSSGGGSGAEVSEDTPSDSGPPTAPPAILSWTGTPPAVGQAFNVTGTVTAVSSGTLTVTLKSGGAVGGVVTFTPGGGSPPTATGASVELDGTRTGPNTYQLTGGSVSQGGSGYGWNTSSATGPSGPSNGSGSSGPISSSSGSGSSGSSDSSSSTGPVSSSSSSSANGSSTSGSSSVSGSASGPTAPGSQPTILSWTGSPPAVGQTFDLQGTVSAIGSDTVTVTLAPGAISGAVTLSSLCRPPAAAIGATVELSGTRTGADTYQITTVAIDQSATAAVTP